MKTIKRQFIDLITKKVFCEENFEVVHSEGPFYSGQSMFGCKEKYEVVYYKSYFGVDVTYFLDGSKEAYIYKSDLIIKYSKNYD
jgi:hypothetical protein